MYPIDEQIRRLQKRLLKHKNKRNACQKNGDPTGMQCAQLRVLATAQRLKACRSYQAAGQKFEVVFYK